MKLSNTRWRPMSTFDLHTKNKHKESEGIDTMFKLNEKYM